MIERILRKIAGLVNRSAITAVDGSKSMRTVQAELLAEDVRERVEHFEPYGFTSEPHIGAEGLMVSLDGDRDHTLAVIIADRRYRLRNLQAGEVALYDDLGRCVMLRRDEVLVDAKDAPVVINTTSTLTATVGSVATVKASKIVLNTPIVECTGEVIAKGDITDHNGAGGRSMSSMRSVYNSHVHVHGDSSSNAPTQKM